MGTDALARDALGRWPLPAGAAAEPIGVSENATYRVTAAGRPVAVLRVPPPGARRAVDVESELAWVSALRDAGTVETAAVLSGRDGRPVQMVGGRPLAMFAHLDGAAPDPGGDLRPGFEALGAVAARCHAHAREWVPPPGFARPRWDAEAVFGAGAHWGDWRVAASAEDRAALEEVERAVRDRLTALGEGADRFGLIHADMRLANLLVAGDAVRVIDFDDCGFGWHLYDFAAAVSFMEDDPRLPALWSAWLCGYAREAGGPPVRADAVGAAIMLRRMALTAWLAGHPEAAEARRLGHRFAADSARLGRRWLAGDPLV